MGLNGVWSNLCWYMLEHGEEYRIDLLYSSIKENNSICLNLSYRIQATHCFDCFTVLFFPGIVHLPVFSERFHYWLKLVFFLFLVARIYFEVIMKHLSSSVRVSPSLSIFFLCFICNLFCWDESGWKQLNCCISGRNLPKQFTACKPLNGKWG